MVAHTYFFFKLIIICGENRINLVSSEFFLMCNIFCNKHLYFSGVEKYSKTFWEAFTAWKCTRHRNKHNIITQIVTLSYVPCKYTGTPMYFSHQLSLFKKIYMTRMFCWSALCRLRQKYVGMTNNFQVLYVNGEAIKHTILCVSLGSGVADLALKRAVLHQVQCWQNSIKPAILPNILGIYLPAAVAGLVMWSCIFRGIIAVLQDFESSRIRWYCS